MRIKHLLVLLPLLLIAVAPAKADQDSVWVNGSYSSISDGYGIGPYGGTLNGVATQFFCVDFNDQISANTGWNANVTGLTNTSGYSQTLQGNQTFYLQAAWLVTQMMNPNNSQALDAQYQWAIWYLSVPKAEQNGLFPEYSTDLYWDNLALSAVNLGLNVSGWEILTPIGGYGQEFLVPGGPGGATPEPRTIVLLLAGMAAFLIVLRRK